MSSIVSLSFDCRGCTLLPSRKKKSRTSIGLDTQDMIAVYDPKTKEYILVDRGKLEKPEDTGTFSRRRTRLISARGEESPDSDEQRKVEKVTRKALKTMLKEQFGIALSKAEEACGVTIPSGTVYANDFERIMDAAAALTKPDQGRRSTCVVSGQDLFKRSCDLSMQRIPMLNERSGEVIYVDRDEYEKPKALSRVKSRHARLVERDGEKQKLKKITTSTLKLILRKEFQVSLQDIEKQLDITLGSTVNEHLFKMIIKAAEKLSPLREAEENMKKYLYEDDQPSPKVHFDTADRRSAINISIV